MSVLIPLLSDLSVVNGMLNYDIAIAHFKEITMKPMLTNVHILNDMPNVMVNVLKSCNETVIDLFAGKMYLDFALLWKKG